MPELRDSVIMPREDFYELSAVAFDNGHVPSLGERSAQVVQTAAITAALAASFGAGTWLWVKALDWRERRAHERRLAEKQFNAEHNIPS